MMFGVERIEAVLTIDDPMPTTGAPMRFRCPVGNFNPAWLRIGWYSRGVTGRN
jgi:hypothetical protein